MDMKLYNKLISKWVANALQKKKAQRVIYEHFMKHAFDHGKFYTKPDNKGK